MEEKGKMMTTPMVSVIVPIYKVRGFIARCADSLLGQTLQNVEFIFVNDCTPDDSMDVLAGVIDNYPNRSNRIKIIDHDVNKGLPTARNTGLSAATGKYIYHCDSDDYMEKNMLERLVVSAEKIGADFVWCDWFLTFEKGERRMVEPSASSVLEAINNIMAGVMKYNVWNKLVKHELYLKHNIRFPDGHAMGEDMTMIKLLSLSKGIGYVSEPLYHYVKMNVLAYTSGPSSLNLTSILHNADETVSFIKNNLVGVKDKDVSLFLLNVKLPLLISNCKEDYIRWLDLYPEANRYIWANKKMSLRTKIVETMAVIRQFWFLRLYNELLQGYYNKKYR